MTEAPPESLPDYSSPNTAIPETTIPASKASIEVIASLHAWRRSKYSRIGRLRIYTRRFCSHSSVCPKFSIRRSDRSVIRSPDRPIAWSVPSMRRSTWGAIWMWRWIKHWADWLRYDRLPLSRLAGVAAAFTFATRSGSNRVMHCRSPGGPIPSRWRLSFAFPRMPVKCKGDFLLQFPDMAPLAAEVVRPEHGRAIASCFAFRRQARRRTASSSGSASQLPR